MPSDAAYLGGQAFGVVCAVCAVQCVVDTSYQPACAMDAMKRHDFQTRLP